MQARHLLSCSSCGRQLAVSRQKAGQTIPCPCGATLEIPTLLELSKLPVAPEPAASDSPPNRWGLAERLVLSGSAVCLLSLAVIAVLLFSFPARPVKPSLTPEQIRQRTAQFSAADCLVIWRELEAAGVKQLWIDDQLGYQERVIKYEESVLAHQMGIGLLAAFCAAGIGLVVAGLVTRGARGKT